MSEALPTPIDVRLMNAAAALLYAAFGVLLAAAAVWWALRHPLFAIGGISVHGEVAHNNVATLRANVAPRLAGNFFTTDLRRSREAFEAVPWVRRAVVRRQFPNRLRVELQEHHAAAYWGADSESRLVNTFGEVFEANPGDVDAEVLPRLAGPEGSAAQVLAMHRALAPLFEPLDLSVEQLTLSVRGGWTAQLDTGAVVELGRGSADEVRARAERFVRTLTQVAQRFGRRPDALVSADLRHGDGYAVRLRGVATTDAQAPRRN